MALRFYTKLVALSTAVLIFAGGLVTSTGSGLSVPEWPNTYGWNMFLFPLDKMVGGIRYEHSHRLIGQLGEIDGLSLRGATSREVEQPADDGAHAQRLREDHRA